MELITLKRASPHADGRHHLTRLDRPDTIKRGLASLFAVPTISHLISGMDDSSDRGEASSIAMKNNRKT